ncbi:hypothetical protein Y032_0037g3424 [Ancylostoma ceylanicum]|uniref:Uncharacterized protein n=1 Tax=Ancylostoma ceylanicum TaxID=53326 RepID=A0A016UK93_9BILA|nr:hypothetical protein Y032_0037g3424 [Ancylostoma ceylanicum]
MDTVVMTACACGKSSETNRSENGSTYRSQSESNASDSDEHRYACRERRHDLLAISDSPPLARMPPRPSRRAGHRMEPPQLFVCLLHQPVLFSLVGWQLCPKLIPYLFFASFILLLGFVY